MRKDEQERNKLTARASVTGCDKKRSRLAVAFLFATASLLNAQSTIDFTYQSFGLEDEASNVIGNASYLDDFFEKLYCQKSSNDQKITIVHIGDSHIQADYLTSVVRRNFQTYFGNAGRGLIVPYQVAGTNEPPNFITRSNIRWNSKRCVHMAEPLPIGIGGITIHSTETPASVEIMMNDLWLDYAFDRLTLFYESQSSYGFNITDTTGAFLASINPGTSTGDYSKVRLPFHTAAVVVQTLKLQEHQRQATIFGFSVENGSNGVLYHAIGVNGAKYMHYNAASGFAKQTSGLSPDLFIISLGTNESIDYPNVDKNLQMQIHKLVTSLRNTNPSAKFLLITPPSAFRKKNKHNPGIATIRTQILQYAVENGYAFYDMYKALGADDSAHAWRNAGLLRGDGVHFTREGYEYQGNLLFNAFMKSYNSYVPLRHP